MPKFLCIKTTYAQDRLWEANQEYTLPSPPNKHFMLIPGTGPIDMSRIAKVRERSMKPEMVRPADGADEKPAEKAE